MARGARVEHAQHRCDEIGVGHSYLTNRIGVPIAEGIGAGG
jgi:hypothetical protein